MPKRLIIRNGDASCPGRPTHSFTERTRTPIHSELQAKRNLTAPERVGAMRAIKKQITRFAAAPASAAGPQPWSCYGACQPPLRHPRRCRVCGRNVAVLRSSSNSSNHGVSRFCQLQASLPCPRGPRKATAGLPTIKRILFHIFCAAGKSLRMPEDM